MIENIIQNYNEIGWVVMPIKANTKQPIMRNWSKIKSNEETEDKFNDDSNLGVLMGEASNIMCIDVDVKHTDGVGTLDKLQAQYGELPMTVMSETPSGGIHYYFKFDNRIINRKYVGEGIDIQSTGTQTLEYPSTINDGKYEWVFSPFEYDVAELPEKWLNMLCGDDEVQLINQFEKPSEVKEGGRNNTIASFVGSMLGRKLKKATIMKEAQAFNKEACEPPLDSSEVETIVNSMIKTDIHNKTERVKQAITHEESDENTGEIEWLTFDETGSPFIDEKKFSEWYVAENDIHCVNGRFFNRYGVISDDKFLADIHSIIGSIVKNKLASKTADLLNAVKNEGYEGYPVPDPFKVQFDNISFDLRYGRLDSCEPFFTLHQIPHNYDPNAKCPLWLKFINELFYEEDIPVVQEYLGYCLMPNTLAQTSLFITGEGGEGKSRITIMLEHILGANSVVIGDFKGLQDKFSMASLDNQMLFIDDDLSLDALDDTSNFKKIVTAETKLEVEPKGKPKYKTKLYSKILCCGNGAVSSKFDRSDGFYRRLLISKVKPLNRTRKPDRLLAEKLKEETSGIINWLLEGALRVVKNGFVIQPSVRMASQVQELRDNSDTISLFLTDNQFIDITGKEEDKASIRQLYDCYEVWCRDNGHICLSQNTFSRNVRGVYKHLLSFVVPDLATFTDMIATERVRVDGKQVRGMIGVKIKNFERSFTINA